MSAGAQTAPAGSDRTGFGDTAQIIAGQALGRVPAGAAEQDSAYLANVRARRLEAEQYVAAIRSGARLPADAAETLRRELQADLEQWRLEFTIGRKEWQTMRARWLLDSAALTPEQWAQRRVDWFAERDEWIAQRALSGPTG